MYTVISDEDNNENANEQIGKALLVRMAFISLHVIDVNVKTISSAFTL